MISKKMETALNNQVKEEIASAYLYLAMSAAFTTNNYFGAASWMRVQYEEEMKHAFKIFDFINERGGRAILQAIDAPKADWNSLFEAYEAAYKHEQYITGCINSLVKLAREEDDPASESFLNWYVDEQVEEEASADEIVQKLKMVGDAPHALYMLDKELGARASQ